MSGILDVPVFINLLFSIGIVMVSIWGYVRIKRFTPLYFGIAYTLFAISHFLLLFQADSSPGSPFFFFADGRVCMCRCRPLCHSLGHHPPPGY